MDHKEQEPTMIYDALSRMFLTIFLLAMLLLAAWLGFVADSPIMDLLVVVILVIIYFAARKEAVYLQARIKEIENEFKDDDPAG